MRDVFNRRLALFLRSRSERGQRVAQFRSLHDCFTRRLKPGARPIDQDPDILVSPCDAIVGAHGAIRRNRRFIRSRAPLLRLPELLCDDELAEAYRNGRYVTLRLTSSMYHRFHAPHDCRVEHVAYIPGDTWNVNPAALRRVDKLYCKNERAVLRTRLAGDRPRHVYGSGRSGARRRYPAAFCRCRTAASSQRAATAFACDARVPKGEEMGWFEHGSTIIVFAPDGFSLCDEHQGGRKNSPRRAADAAAMSAIAVRPELCSPRRTVQLV